jgi:hypothetical protein
VSLAYVNGDLRDFMIGDVEVLRRVYVVFQDRNWTARPWTITEESIFVGKERFEISYSARGTFDAEPFTFTATLSGDEEGTISFEFDGTAEAPFIRNRLGLCVLHPMSAAGAACLVETITGETTEARFPTEISPNQPFLDVRAITHEFTPGAWASVRLSGETFEMEDHRNWSDASFKTYCTPISLPFPVEVSAGEEVYQGLTLAVDIEDIQPTPAPERPIVQLPADAATHRVPRYGLQLPADEPSWSPRTVELLRELPLSHLRIDVSTRDPDTAGRIRAGAARAADIGCALVVALFVDDPTHVATVAGAVSDVDVTEWLVFDARSKVSGSELAAVARAAFGPGARIGGGTNLYFTELNREPPDTSGLDVVAFSLNPQVHASDNVTIVQNLAAQAVVARDARRIAREANIHVGPVTLRPRFNPNATEPALDHSTTALPANVDARQSSRLGANWTLGSLKYLAEAGTVDEVTYYETTGWRGVIEREDGSPQPDDFVSTPGQPYPVYAALLALAGFDSVRTCTSSLPQQVDALLLERGDGERRLIVMSFSAESMTVDLDGFGDGLTTITLEPLGLEILDLRKVQA